MVEIATQTEFDHEQQSSPRPHNSLSTQTTSTSSEYFKTTSIASSLSPPNCLPEADSDQSSMNNICSNHRAKSSSLKSSKSNGSSHNNRCVLCPFGAEPQVHNGCAPGQCYDSLPKQHLKSHGGVKSSCTSDDNSRGRLMQEEPAYVSKTVYVVNQPPQRRQHTIANARMETKSLKDLVSFSRQEQSLNCANVREIAAPSSVDVDNAEQYLGYLECSHCGALSAKSLDKIHIVPATYNTLDENVCRSKLSRSEARLAYSLSKDYQSETLPLYPNERSARKHRSRDVADRKDRNRSRSNSKQVHYAGDVASSDRNSMRRSRTSKSLDDPMSENCYDSIDTQNPVYVQSKSNRGAKYAAYYETSFWGPSKQVNHPSHYSEPESKQSSSVTTDSREGSLQSSVEPTVENATISKMSPPNSYCSMNNISGSQSHAFIDHVNANSSHPAYYHHPRSVPSLTYSSCSKPKSLFPPFWKKGSFILRSRISDVAC